MSEKYKDMNKTKQKYWYKIEIGECVLCGSQRKYKERVYKKIEAIRKYTQFACDCHFM